MERHKALLRQFIERVWNKGDFADLDVFVKFPYTIHYDPGDPWEFKQLDKAMFQDRVLDSRRVFPDLHFTLLELVVDENKVATRWVFEGTYQGEIKGLPAPTGQKVKVSGLTIYGFSEGKINGHWQVVDRLGFIQQL